jgi:hypothetical protein
MWRSLMVVLVLTLAASAQVSQPATGSAEGVVLDGDGKPLSGATVFVGNLAKAPRTMTDAEGRFILKGLPVGKIALMAYKESDGYPYNMFSFYSVPGGPPPEFDVAEGETVRNAVIHLGAKAAYLKLEVTDEAGAQVNAGLLFSRPDLGRYGDYRRSAKANDVILVPSVPFRLTVEAKGFQPWRSGEDPQNKDGLIALKSGETRTLTIRLRK